MSLLGRIRSGSMVLADGATGSMLRQRGLSEDACAEAWNLDRPGILEELAREYVEAGAEMIVANTFGAVGPRLARHGLENRAGEINRAAVEAARRGAQRARPTRGTSGTAGPGSDRGPVWIAGSIGPPPEEAGSIEAVRLQVAVLLEAGVDLLLLETMTRLDRALEVLAAARSLSADLPIAVTFAFRRVPAGFVTVAGDPLPRVVAAVAGAGADLIGANCGVGLAETAAVAAEIHRASPSSPALYRPSAGLPVRRAGRLVWPDPPEAFAAHLPLFVSAGAAVLGGCCGTTPDHIRALRTALGRGGR